MICKYNKLIVLVIWVSLFACQEESQKSAAEQSAQSDATAAEAEGIPTGATTVCIWDRAVLRSEPSREKGKWRSSIALGEKVTWLGESYVDSSDNNLEFHKVRLSDGTEGWVLAYVLVRDAVPAAVTQKTFIYRRPDLLTVTEETFAPMDMVAVSKMEADWLEVVGNQRKKSGWIKRDGVSLKDEDVAVAILATKAFQEEDESKRRQKLEAIVENPELANSVFLAAIRNMLTPDQSPEETLEGTEEPIQSNPSSPEEDFN